MYSSDAEVEQQVRTAMQAYIASVQARDVSAIMEWFVEGDAPTVITGGKLILGWEAIREQYFANVFTLVPDDVWAPGELTVRSLGTDAAHVAYPYVATGTYKGTPFRVEGMGTNTWVRTAAGWRVAHEHCHVNRQQ